jgi:hypothetical protein
VGHYASYGRCVESTKISHGKRKGQGNGKNGHPYLGWASMEAPQFARRFHPSAQRFSQRTLAKSHNNTPLARKTVDVSTLFRTQNPIGFQSLLIDQWREIAIRGMAALTVIEHFDVFKHSCLGVFVRVKLLQIHQLGL